MSAHNETSLNNTNDSSLPVVPIVITLSFISFCSIVGNSLVCLAIYRQPRLRTVMYLPLLSLAIADLLCGAVAMPAYIAKKLVDGNDGEGIVCDVFRFTYFFTEYASVSSLVIVSVERVYSIKFPFERKETKFRRKIIALLILAWLDAVLVAALPFIPWEADARGPCSYNPTRWWSLMVIHKNVFIPLLVVILCYSYIYKIAMSHVKTIRKVSRPTNSVKSKMNEWRQRGKATTTLLIVVGIFLLCWLPSSIYYYIQNVCEHCFDSLVGESKSIFNAVVKILTFFNSMTNPIIYWWRSRDFRQAFRRMFFARVFRSCGVSPNGPNTHSRVGFTTHGQEYSETEA